MLFPDSASTPIILAIALAMLLAGLVTNAVLKDRREYRRFKLLRTTKRRQRVYRRWLLQSFALFGGSSVVTLLLSWQFIPPLLADINQWGWIADARLAFDAGGWLVAGITAGVIAAIVIVGTLGIFAARPRDGDTTAIPAIGDIQALLPRNRAELKYGALLSINAGVVEELLFRLALPAVVFGITGSSVAAVVGSLVVFALLHLYQGVAGVLGSLLIGAVLMAIYIATGSIIVAIIVHVLFDLRSLVLIPVVVFRVHKQLGSNPPPRVSSPTAE
jgi:membrane protease YdiL (CAAX protease family)